MAVAFQYHGLDFHTLEDAKALDLMQLTHWLINNSEEREYIQKEYQRISNDKTRICLPVLHRRQIALFVNRVA